jgi:hypothetical protein
MVMVFFSCDNLFHHEYGPAIPAPVVERIMPGDNERNVACNVNVLVYFSCEMKPESIHDSSVLVEKIEDGSGIQPVRRRVFGSLELVNNRSCVAAFRLPGGEDYEAGSTYRVTVKRGIRALSGKILEDDVESTFFTGGFRDTAPLELVRYFPEYLVNAQNTLADVSIILVFNKPLDPASLLQTSLHLTDEGSPLNFRSRVIRPNEIFVNALKPNEAVFQSSFARPLEAPGLYLFSIEQPGAIRDHHGNSYRGASRFSIHHLKSYIHPRFAPCGEPGCRESP